MSNNSPHQYQNPESKKEEYRRYLERTGVIDSLTKALVGLYEEQDKPLNAVDYVKRSMLGDKINTPGDSKLQKENEQLKAQVKELQNKVDFLTKQLNATKSSSGTAR